MEFNDCEHFMEKYQKFFGVKNIFYQKISLNFFSRHFHLKAQRI